jgi:diaminopimelate epimerase
VAHYQYQIFIPGGNKTALVLGIDGLEDNSALRKAIQDKILAKHEYDVDGEVEQVGFVSIDKTAPQLIMTGGEFCGNATRSAAAYYLSESQSGNIEIKVSGTGKPVKAGLSSMGKQLDAWAEMPLFENLSQAVIPLSSGLYWVSIEGISHLIVPQEQSAPYLSKILSCENKNEQINIAIQFLKQTIEENSFSPGKACGIMFLDLFM